jgi:hypothetical protein
MSSTNSMLSQFYSKFQTSAVIDKNLLPVPGDEDMYFGILNLDTGACQMTKKVQDFVFAVDRSGSMQDRCRDGHCKMEHIQHTLTNIVQYLCDISNMDQLEIYITVFMFDDNVEIAVPRTIISKNTIEDINKKIRDIKANGSTDIEKALTEVSSYIYNLSVNNPDHFINHIFMTDGQITAGSNNYDTLKKYVPGLSGDTVSHMCNSAFVGFGLDHDSMLLNHLADDKNCSYYFIDAIERSGLVYGEILHSILYKLISDVEIIIENGVIYDYKNNIWSNSIMVGNITSEVNKVFHLASAEPMNCYALLKYTGADILTRSNILIDLDIKLDNYIYRQRTLQLLAEVKEFQENNYNNYNNYNYYNNNYYDTAFNRNIRIEINDKRAGLKNKLKLFYDELKKYMTDNGLEDDKVLKNLCDDIYICHKTFGTRYGAMFSCARQTSQGTQRAYSANQAPIPRQDFGMRRNLRRADYHDSDLDNEDDNENEENDDILDHEVSGFIDTPYLSQTVTMVMRAVNGCDLNDSDATIMN